MWMDKISSLNENKSGIYIIINTINKKGYVGKTIQSFRLRFNEHKSQANNGSKMLIHEAMRKYGFENFRMYELEIMENVSSEELKFREIDFIITMNTWSPHKNGYNTKLENYDKNDIVYITDEIRYKMGSSNRGKKKSQEQKDKISKTLKERYKTQNHPRKGSKHTQKEIDHLREINLCDKNHFYGKSHTKETKQILSDKAKERFKDKTKHPCYGKSISLEHKAKLQAINTGKPSKSKLPVKQIDKTTEKLIKIWSSLSDAGYNMSGNPKSGPASICSVISSKPDKRGYIKKTAYGYKWEKATKEEYESWIKNNPQN